MPAADGAIFILSRKVNGDNGQVVMQNVTVYADSAEEARAIVYDQFARLRRISRSPENAYQPTPEFSVDKVSLDRHKLITAGFTSS